MSRYTGPRLRIIRKLGYLPGLTRKISTRTTRPGQHGNTRKKISQYGVRLQEKQKLRYNYGINEKQLIRYIRLARKTKGSTGEILLQFLEMRLDNIIFRLGFAPTISAARQLITHGHFLINDKKINIPSYQCSINDKISVSKRKQSQNIVSIFSKENKNIISPPHLLVDKQNLSGIVVSIVNREYINLGLNELLVVEFYSRKV